MRVSACKVARRCCIWHRSKTAEARRKLVRLPGDHQPLSHPARPCGLSAMKMLLYATGMAPARVFRSRGGGFRVNGPSGPLTGVYEGRTAFFLPHIFSGPELSTAESWGPLWGSDSVVDNCT